MKENRKERSKVCELLQKEIVQDPEVVLCL